MPEPGDIRLRSLCINGAVCVIRRRQGEGCCSVASFFFFLFGICLSKGSATSEQALPHFSCRAQLDTAARGFRTPHMASQNQLHSSSGIACAAAHVMSVILRGLLLRDSCTAFAAQHAAFVAQKTGDRELTSPQPFTLHSIHTVHRQGAQLSQCYASMILGRTSFWGLIK